jgi:hydrogenase expression/formation protein HypE
MMVIQRIILPLYLANEGKLVACVRAQDAGGILEAMRRTRYGEEAVAPGRVLDGPAGQVRLKIAIGAHAWK